MSLLITNLLARWGYHIGVSAGVLVAFFAWNTKMVHKGVEKERARVEVVGKKTNVEAQAARKKAEANPDAALKPYYRD